MTVASETTAAPVAAPIDVAVGILMKPNGDATFFEALFSRCLKWNDGYVLVGRALKGNFEGYGWLVNSIKTAPKNGRL